MNDKRPTNDYSLELPCPPIERQAQMEHDWSAIAARHGAVTTYILKAPNGGKWNFTACFAPDDDIRAGDFALYWKAQGLPLPIVSVKELPS